LCAVGKFRRYICTEFFRGEAEEINVLVSLLILVKIPATH